MIELNYGNLMNPHFHEGLKRLCAHKGFTIVMADRVRRIREKLIAKYSEAEALRNNITLKYAQKDEEGKPVINEEASKSANVLIRPDDHAAFLKDLEEFSVQKCQINLPQVALEKLEGANLSADELSAIAPLIDFGSEEEEKTG
jgi:hypothetical protein